MDIGYGFKFIFVFLCIQEFVLTFEHFILIDEQKGLTRNISQSYPFGIHNDWLYRVMDESRSIQRIHLVGQDGGREVWLDKEFAKVTDLVFDGDSMYVLDDGILKVCNMATKEVQELRNIDYGLVISLQRKDRLWVTGKNESVLIDLNSNSTLAYVEGEFDIYQHESVGDDLYLTTSSSIQLLNSTTMAFNLFQEMEPMYGIASFERDLFVGERSSGKIYRISIDHPSPTVERNLNCLIFNIEISPDFGGTMFVFSQCLTVSGLTAVYYIIPISFFHCFDIARNDSTVCSGHGGCIADDKCFCQTNYDGVECEEWECYGNSRFSGSVCNSNGNCTGHNTCECNPDWTGSECEQPICFETLDCHGFGECISPNNCSCHSGHSGDECLEYQCFLKDSTDPTVCNKLGTCVSANKCDCFPNYHGGACQRPNMCYGKLFAEPSVCSGHGNCTTDGNCTCASGWTGSLCDKAICFNQTNDDLGIDGVCNGNGICVGPDKCLCRLWASGDECIAVIPTLAIVLFFYIVGSMAIFMCIISVLLIWSLFLCYHRTTHYRVAVRPPTNPRPNRRDQELQEIFPRVIEGFDDHSLTNPVFNNSLLCPITQEIMEKPVVLVESGHNFEEDAIMKWLLTNRTCPVTRKKLHSKLLVRNRTLEKMIQDYLELHSSNVDHEFTAPLFLQNHRLNFDASDTAHLGPPPEPIG